LFLKLLFFFGNDHGTKNLFLMEAEWDVAEFDQHKFIFPDYFSSNIISLMFFLFSLGRNSSALSFFFFSHPIASVGLQTPSTNSTSLLQTATIKWTERIFTFCMLMTRF
jgi:hypothetical protein